MPFITPKFRGSFVNLVEPRAPAPEADAVYSIAIVLPKDDPETKAFMKRMEGEAKTLLKERFGNVPKKLKKAWKDGDEEDRPEWEGCWIINAKTKSRPGVIDTHRQDVLDNDLLYSGAFYKASLGLYVWDHPTGGKGVSANLNNVLWVEHGERFDNRTAAGDDFKDDFVDEAKEAAEQGDDGLGEFD